MSSDLEQTLAALTTEQTNPTLADLDTLSIEQRCALQNRMDAEVASAVAMEIPQIAEAVRLIWDALRAGGHLFYVGAGTSGRLGVLDASECPPTFGTDPRLVQGIIAGGNIALTTAVEGVEDSADAGANAIVETGVTANDIVVGITASGRTPFVLGAILKANELGAITIGLTNNRPSELEAVCNGLCIAVVVGPEIVAGSTRLKAGTAQKLVLNMLTTQTMIELGKTYGSYMVDVLATNEKLKIRATRIVMDVTGASREEAVCALNEANGSAKITIVMLAKGVDASMAGKLLKDAEGRLRYVLTTQTSL